MKPLLGVGVVLLVAFGLLWWGPWRDGGTTVDEASSSAADATDVARVDADAEPDAAEVPAAAEVAVASDPDSTDPGSRAAVAACTVTLVSDGAPRTVRYRWIPLEERLDADVWQLQDWRFVRERCPLEQATLGSEALTLEAPPGAHVLWAFPERAVSMWHLSTSGSAIFEVVDTPPCRVRVERDGSPVAGATVELFGTGAGVGGGLGPVVAAETYLRRVVTAADGTVEVEPWPGQVALVATHDGARSRAFGTRAAPEFVLSLGDTFALEGRVGDGTGNVAEAHVEVGTVGETSWDVLGRVGVAADGTFALADVPLADTAEVYVSLRSHGGLAPQMTFRPAPAAGEVLRVDLPVERGRPLAVQVLDEERAPLRGVHVMLTWGDTTDFPYTSDWRATDDEGIARFASARIGPVGLRTSRDGFGVRGWPVVDEAAWADGTHVVRYLASREVELRGTTTDGEAPERFTVWHWRGLPRDATTHEVGPDGLRLSLEEGRHWFLAAGPGLARTAPRALDVDATTDATLTFELVEPRRAHGRLVDERGEPVGGAYLQPYVNCGSQLLAPFGELLVADDEGRFEGRFLAEGDNRVLAQAADGSPTIFAFHADPERTAALGDVPLYDPRDLVLELAPSLAALGRHRLSVVGGVRHEPEQVDEDGRFVLERAAPGGYTTVLQHPDGSQSVFRLHQHPAGPWRRTIGGGADATLVHDPELLHRDLRTRAVQLHVTAHDPGLETRVTRVFGVGEEPVTLAAIPHGRVMLQWLAADETVLARSHLDVAPGERVHARTGDWPRDVVLRFTTLDGAPLAGATVWYGQPDGPDGWDGLVATGPDGRAELGGLAGDVLRLGVGHPAHGYAFDLEVALGAWGDEVEVVVGFDATLAVRLVDGDAPVVGVETFLAVAEPRTNLFATAPDPEGWARFGALGPGRYRVVVRVPGAFPLDEVVTVEGRTETTIALRRTGDLELEVAGSAVGPLGLVDRTSGISVATWIAEGRCAGSLVPDGEGRCRIEGLPHGTYELRAGDVRRQVEVRAGETARTRLELP